MISPISDKYTPSKDLTSVITSISNELEHLARFVDVHAVMLFRLDGKVLESRYETENSQDLLIVTSWVKNIILKTMEELKRGSRSVKYDKEISPGKNIPVYFYRAGNSGILVTFLTSRANLGLMEIEMSRSSKRLGKIIDYKKSLGS
jgi:predicted regulator of Ras-like GTPase activity (Roadblock/LC7/MglB family)